jgi:hypothetical protein
VRANYRDHADRPLRDCLSSILTNVTVNEFFSEDPPNPRNAVKLFEGEWSSQLPGSLGAYSGSAPLFADDRIRTAIDHIGGISGSDVLELGPLEGGHSYMLQEAGAKSVIAIEANSRAYLRCLISKELLGLDQVRFQFGDFRPFLNTTDQRFDLVVMIGVLYHMLDPVSLLEDVARVTDKLILWTHYVDPTQEDMDENLARRIETPSNLTSRGGRSYRGYQYPYLEAVEWQGFCGGTRRDATWLDRDSLMSSLASIGFSVDVLDDQPGAANGPALLAVASAGNQGN